VPLNAWVRRFWKKQQKRLDPIGLVTPALALSASWSGRHDAARPEIAQDEEQRQKGGWQLQKRRATRSR